VGLLPGCRRSEPLTVASYVWPGYEFMFMAQREGWLDPQRVQLREPHPVPETMKAFDRRFLSTPGR